MSERSEVWRRATRPPRDGEAERSRSTSPATKTTNQQLRHRKARHGSAGKAPKNRMRPTGQPPVDRIVRVFLPCPLSPRRRRHDRFSPIALSPFRTTSATFAKASRRFAIMRSRTRNRLRWPAALSCSEEQSQRRRPQRPGNQSRSRAFLDVSPGDPLSRITGCRWLCRNHPAKSGTLTFR